MFLGLADNIFVDTPSLGTPGLGWVLQPGGVQATLDIDFVVGRAIASGVISTIPSLLTCARATPVAAYYQNADLTLSTFAANTLRFGSNGLLVEESRTNIILRSQEFNNATWSTGQSSISANTTIALDGTLTADTLTEDGTTNSHYVFPTATIVAASNVTYTKTLYVKPNGRTKIEMYILDGPPGALNFNLGKFNLSGSGTVISATNGGTGSGAVASINALANGWYRIVLTGQPSSANSGVVSVIIALLDNSGNENYAGDGVSGAIIWGSDLQAGAFAISYIPTTTVAVTRATDMITATSLSWLNQSAGTHYCEAVTPLNVDTQFKYLLNLHKTGAEDTNRQVVYRGFSSTAYAVDGQTGGTLSLSPGSVAQSSSIKVALAIAANNCACSINGANAVVDNSVTIETDFDKYVFGNNIGFPDRALNSYIKRFTYWNSRLSDGALQTLTT